MDKIKMALDLLNKLTVTGIDNCTKVAFISQLINDAINESKENVDDGNKEHKFCCSKLV